MRRLKLFCVVFVLAVGLLACGDGEPDRAADLVVEGPAGMRTMRTGGFGTAIDDSARAFSLTARNINHYERQAFADGKAVFEAAWTADGTGGFRGLGPNFDAVACSSCHLEDGRAAGPSGDGDLPIGLTAELITDDPALIDDLGAMLSAHSVGGDGEAIVRVTYEDLHGVFEDGSKYTLRRPTYSVALTDGSVLPAETVIGVRVAPQLPGMGLLELNPEAEILALSDPDDVNGDGISGQVGRAEDLLAGAAAICGTRKPRARVVNSRVASLRL